MQRKCMYMYVCMYMYTYVYIHTYINWVGHMRYLIIEYTGCHSGLVGTLLISFIDGMRMKGNEKCLKEKN